MATGNLEAAWDLLSKALTADVRCLDAHDLMGGSLAALDPREAMIFFEVGWRIGEMSLGAPFSRILPWSLAGNRPFLACLFGFAACA